MIEALILILFVCFFGLMCISEDKRYHGKQEKIQSTYVECSKVDVRESEFGLGCFANRNLTKGEVIETGVMIPLPGVDGDNQPHLHTWSDDRKLFACGSGSLPFYNHSEEPNVIKIGDLSADRMRVIALRDIAKGEELRSRYMSKAWRGCFKNF